MDDLEWIKAELERQRPLKNQRGLALAMGIDATGVNRMLKGNRRISIDEMRSIRAYLTGTPQPVSDNHNPKDTRKELATPPIPNATLLPGSRPPPARDLPIRGHTKGGKTGFFLDQGSLWGFAMRPETLRDIAEAYAVRVDDDSMAERFVHGNVLQVDPFRPVRPGDNVVLQLSDGQCFIKILVRRTEKAVICRQLNPAENIEFKASDVDKIHLVVGVDYLER